MNKIIWSPEIAAKQRARRAANDNKTTRKYEKTPNGFLMRLYRNMESRVTGVQHLKAHLYLGKPILDREQFYTWAKDSEQFWSLFKLWEASGYARLITPSVDRIDSKGGYVLGNIRWITFQENSRLGAVSRNAKK